LRNTSKEKIEFAQRLADAMEMKGIKQSPTTLQNYSMSALKANQLKCILQENGCLAQRFQDKTNWFV
jgi:hypothetical protein